MPFEFVDHTGDIAVHLVAESLPGLFEAAAEAFTSVLCDLDRVEPRQAETITLAAPALELLLVDWLSELLYRFEVRSFLVRRSQVAVSNSRGTLALEAAIEGEPFNPQRHAVKVLVKAVTYHGLTVERSAEGWQATVIFDI